MKRLILLFSILFLANIGHAEIKKSATGKVTELTTHLATHTNSSLRGFSYL